MRRVTPPQTTIPAPGPQDLRNRGLPERVWIVNHGPARELFFDFTGLPEASGFLEVDEVDEPLMMVGLLRSEMRVAGLAAPSRRVAVGTQTGSLWLETGEGWLLINWSTPAFEACFDRRARFHEVEHGCDFEACIREFPSLVSDVLQIEPRLRVRSQVPRYWHRHLQGIAENLGIAAFPFPWQES